jgi:hypothetical protein
MSMSLYPDEFISGGDAGSMQPIIASDSIGNERAHRWTPSRVLILAAFYSTQVIVRDGGKTRQSVRPNEIGLREPTIKA